MLAVRNPPGRGSPVVIRTPIHAGLVAAADRGDKLPRAPPDQPERCRTARSRIPRSMPRKTMACNAYSEYQ
jgi:hypothetical protein